MTAKEYYKLTPREFHEALQDHSKLKDMTQRNIYEAARLICVHVWNASGRVLKDVELDPAKFKMLKFSWDIETIRKQSVDEQMYIMQSIAMVQNKKTGKQ